MSSDSVTKTTSTSFFGRIGNALAGILFGLILLLGSFVLLTWNEGRAIKTEKRLKAGAGMVVSLPSAEALPENEGKLVHFTGTASAGGPVEDPAFGLSAEALRLRRSVEMYQWEQSEDSETKQKLGGSEETTTTYSYSKGWSSTAIDSSQFEVPEGHSNPSSMPVNDATFEAEGIHVGKFDLPPNLVDSIDNFTPRSITAEEAQAAAGLHQMPIHVVSGGVFYLGEDPATPAIGDVKITFEEALPGPVSVIARQLGTTLEPFTVEDLGSIELLKTGTFSAATMFQQEQESNVMLTWVLRLVGFLMMLFGLLMISNILSVVASVIPLLGNIVGAGVGLMAFAVALPLTLLTIALAWLAYRPIIGIPLLLLAGVSIFFAGAKLFKARKKPQPSAS
jgi:hypothetical protein